MLPWSHSFFFIFWCLASRCRPWRCTQSFSMMNHPLWWPYKYSFSKSADCRASSWESRKQRKKKLSVFQAQDLHGCLFCLHQGFSIQTKIKVMSNGCLELLFEPMNSGSPSAQQWSHSCDILRYHGAGIRMLHHQVVPRMQLPMVPEGGKFLQPFQLIAINPCHYMKKMESCSIMKLKSKLVLLVKTRFE